MQSIPEAPARPGAIDAGSAARNIRRARTDLAVASVLGCLLVFFWIRFFSQSVDTEEALSLATSGLTLVSFAVGIPILILLFRSVIHARHARAQGSTTAQSRLIIGIVAVYVVAAVAGFVAADVNLQRSQQRVADRAVPTMFDRTGLAEITHQNNRYRNPNDGCSARSAGFPGSSGCSSRNLPPCRTKQWLVANHSWPLTAVGEVSYIPAGSNGPGSPAVGKPHSHEAILRPTDQDIPQFLLVAAGACYREYLRVQ